MNMEKAKTKTKEKTAKAPKAAGTAKKVAKGPRRNTDAKLFKEYTISKKPSGRFEVTGPNGKNVNGDAKTKILVEAALVKVMKPKAKTDEATT
jgi:hypothetical protein